VVVCQNTHSESLLNVNHVGARIEEGGGLCARKREADREAIESISYSPGRRGNACADGARKGGRKDLAVRRACAREGIFWKLHNLLYSPFLPCNTLCHPSFGQLVPTAIREECAKTQKNVEIRRKKRYLLSSPAEKAKSAISWEFSRKRGFGRRSDLSGGALLNLSPERWGDVGERKKESVGHFRYRDTAWASYIPHLLRDEINKIAYYEKGKTCVMCICVVGDWRGTEWKRRMCQTSDNSEKTTSITCCSQA